MKKCDVLITYEIKNREIENLCLIKRELEKRGYSVEMCMQYDTYFAVPEPIDARVILVPAYYRERAQFYTASHVVKANKIINMQWEQVFENKQEDNLNCLQSIKEWGRNAVHIAWGDYTYNRLTKAYNIPDNNVKVTGHIALDFLRGKLVKYYDEKKCVYQKYKIPIDKRVHLFISSLAYATASEKVIQNASINTRNNDVLEFVEVSKKTQKTLIEWFEQILSENENDVIVYRPHPEEKNSDVLCALEKKEKRFFVINEDSVKQWILICDKIYTWYSTSVAEVYASGKGCIVLRPVQIPYANEMRLFDNTPFVFSYDSFKESFVSNNQVFEIPKKNIQRYYDINNEKYSFELVCDVIEEVYKDDSYGLSQPLENPFGKTVFNKYRFENAIKRYLVKSKLMNYIQKKDWFKNTKFRENLDDVFYVRDKLKKNYVSDEEIAQIIARIDKALG